MIGKLHVNLNTKRLEDRLQELFEMEEIEGQELSVEDVKLLLIREMVEEVTYSKRDHFGDGKLVESVRIIKL